jgi:integrating conjugative element protein (TIGR03759 family)
MNRKISIFAVAFSAALISGAAMAQTQALPVETLPVSAIEHQMRVGERLAQREMTPAAASDVAPLQKLSPAEEKALVHRNAVMWGITDDDWRRVEMLRQGNYKYWSPNIDPLTLLGVNARSDAERARIAAIQARMEYVRTDRELAYQRALSAAYKAMNIPLFRPGHDTERPMLPPRVAVFVKTANCPACLKKVRLLVKDHAAFDLYFIGATDDGIRAWAAKAGVPITEVNSRRITLNHDNGELEEISGKKLPKLPASYRRTPNSGLWVKLD